MLSEEHRNRFLFPFSDALITWFDGKVQYFFPGQNVSRIYAQVQQSFHIIYHVIKQRGVFFVTWIPSRLFSFFVVFTFRFTFFSFVFPCLCAYSHIHTPSHNTHAGHNTNETMTVDMIPQNDTQVAPGGTNGNTSVQSAVGIFKALPFTHAVLDHLARGTFF